MAKCIVIEDVNDISISVEGTRDTDLQVSNVHYLGVDPSNATAREEDVASGKTFYAGENQLKVGKFNGYNVVEEILGEDSSRIVITTMGNGINDDIITKSNIDSYKQQDIATIIQNGGQLASDEEYELAEQKLQKIYFDIMGVEING